MNIVDQRTSPASATAFRIQCWVIGGEIILVPANGVWPPETSFTVEGVTGWAEAGTATPLVIDTSKKTMQ